MGWRRRTGRRSSGGAGRRWRGGGGRPPRGGGRAGGGPRGAGVPWFGISGTNAHVILEQPEPAPDPAAEPAEGEPERERAASVVPWVVSAKSAAALDAQLERVPAVGAPAVDVGLSLATCRSVFGHRAVLLAGGGGVAEVARGGAGPGGVGGPFCGPGAARGGCGAAA